jgi:phage-related tail fiber protein
MIVEVANASQVALTLDPSVIMASQGWVDDFVAEHLNPVHGAAVAALDAAGLANRELLALRQQRMQRGDVTIYNRGLIAGCAISKTGAGRLIQMAAGMLFAHGARQPVLAAVTASEMVPENTGTESATCRAYAERAWDADKAAHRWLLRLTALGGSVPAHGLHLATLTVPANSTLATDADLSGVTIATASGLRTESGWPGVQLAPAYVTVTLAYPYSAADYPLRLEVVSCEGAPPPLEPESLATNSFRINVAGDADTVKVRWQTIRP